jgi:hypothetical protein
MCLLELKLQSSTASVVSACSCLGFVPAHTVSTTIVVTSSVPTLRTASTSVTSTSLTTTTTTTTATTKTVQETDVSTSTIPFTPALPCSTNVDMTLISGGETYNNYYIDSQMYLEPVNNPGNIANIPYSRLVVIADTDCAALQQCADYASGLAGDAPSPPYGSFQLSYWSSEFTGETQGPPYICDALKGINHDTSVFTQGLQENTLTSPIFYAYSSSTAPPTDTGSTCVDPVCPP